MDNQLRLNSSFTDPNFGAIISKREQRYLRRNRKRTLLVPVPAIQSENSNQSNELDKSEDLNQVIILTTYNFDLFTPWDAKFLDLTDSTLRKLLVKESSFKDKKEKYNLGPKLFESYCLIL